MTRINERALIQRAKDIASNQWPSKLLFQELPTVTSVEDISEVAVMSKETRDDGQAFRMARMAVSNLLSTGGVGIKINGLVIGGVKQVIEGGETLTIPPLWQYNLFQSLDIDGTVDNDGQINFIA